MPWIELTDGTPIHVTLAKPGATLTEADINALREIAEAARRKYAAEHPQADTGADDAN
jgi:hypothetical protein